MLTQTVEYALRAMMCLAAHEGGAQTSVEIAARTGVPKGYLSKVLRGLVCAELVRSYRGPHGGFTLARSIDAISVLDVVSAVEPIPRIRSCPLENPMHSNLCPLHQCLDNALAQLEETFGSTTLGAVVESCATTEGCRALFPTTPITWKDASRDRSA